MDLTFKMAYGKGAYYSLVIGTVVQLILVYIVMTVNYYIGLVFFAFVVLMVWFVSTSQSKSHYEINDHEIIVKVFADRKRRYEIDKIIRIDYIDIGTEWVRGIPNARHQLAIYFERSYLKSVEPRYFAPDDREAFIEALLKINTKIIVDENEKTIN